MQAETFCLMQLGPNFIVTRTSSCCNLRCVKDQILPSRSSRMNCSPSEVLTYMTRESMSWTNIGS